MLPLALLPLLLAAPLNDASGPLPDAATLVDRALTAYEAADADGRRFATASLVRALVDYGRDEQAERIAAASEFSKAHLSDMYGVQVGLRLRALPPPAVLKRIDVAKSPRQEIFVGGLVRALANHDDPAAAESLLPLLTPRTPQGRTARVLGAARIAAAYQRAGDAAGEKRAVAAGLEQAAEADPAFFVMETVAMPLTARAAAVGEEEALRRLLAAGVPNLPSFEEISPSYGVAFWSRTGRWRASLGEPEAAQAAFRTARRLGEKMIDDKASDWKAPTAFAELAADAHAAGFPDEADRVMRTVIELTDAARPDRRDGLLREAVRTSLRAGSLEVADRFSEQVQADALKTAVLAASARQSATTGDAASADRLAAARRAVNATASADLVAAELAYGTIDDFAAATVAAGDHESASAAYGRAFDAALTSEEFHPATAAGLIEDMIEHGLLDEVWADLHRLVDDDPGRVKVWAQLAAAVAAREADAKERGAE